MRPARAHAFAYASVSRGKTRHSPLRHCLSFPRFSAPYAPRTAPTRAYAPAPPGPGAPRTARTARIARNRPSGARARLPAPATHRDAPPRHTALSPAGPPRRTALPGPPRHRPRGTPPRGAAPDRACRAHRPRGTPRSRHRGLPGTCRAAPGVPPAGGPQGGSHLREPRQGTGAQVREKKREIRGPGV